MAQRRINASNSKRMKPKFEDIFNGDDELILLGVGEYVIYCHRNGYVEWVFEKNRCFEFRGNKIGLKYIYENIEEIDRFLYVWDDDTNSISPISKDYVDGMHALGNMTDSEKLLLPKWYKEYIIMESLKR